MTSGSGVRVTAVVLTSVSGREAVLWLSPVLFSVRLNLYHWCKTPSSTFSKTNSATTPNFLHVFGRAPSDLQLCLLSFILFFNVIVNIVPLVFPVHHGGSSCYVTATRALSHVSGIKYLNFYPSFQLKKSTHQQLSTLIGQTTDILYCILVVICGSN